MNWELILKSLSDKSDLTNDQVTWAMSQILEGKASNNEIKDFLIGLKTKGESAAEVEALVAQMYSYSAPINISERSVDTVGTGGDGANTINISTAAAIVTNAAGARVVKHGNRAASSKSGSADVLEALGVLTSMNPVQVKESFQKCGITFCFAPTFHPAMKHAAVARKELGVPTVFNILGPLANPARPQAAAIAHPKNPGQHFFQVENAASARVVNFTSQRRHIRSKKRIKSCRSTFRLKNSALVDAVTNPILPLLLQAQSLLCCYIYREQLTQQAEKIRPPI
mgnify:CR=1 FL=1